MSEHNGRYVLDGQGKPVPEPDLIRWAKWLESDARFHKTDTVFGYRVSTVFLGVDHSFGGEPPVLWETMIFNANGDGVFMGRCGGTQEQAEAQHAAAVAKAQYLEAP